MDNRINYPTPVNWQSNRQAIHGVDPISLEPISKIGNSYEFEITSNALVLFGSNTGFNITGSFKMKDTATATEETTIPLTEYDKVRVQPNWFEHCIKSIDVFHHHSNTRPHETPPYVDSFLNTYFNANMDKITKKYLYFEDSSPGYAVSATSQGWTTEASSDWHKYSKKIFGEDSISFTYIPLHLFPFYQHPNFMLAGNVPNGIPMQGLGKLSIRINFKDNFDHIFRKVSADNAKVYSFQLEEVTLTYEEARLLPHIEKSLMTSKRLLNFAGVTKFGKTENIQPVVQSHRCRFQDILLPEGIFIFALPSSVVGGQYKYSDTTDETVFAKHNITKVELAYGGLPFSLKSPNMGDIGNDVIEKRSLRDHLELPPFGLWQEPGQLDYNSLVDAGQNTPYPHVYLNLCQESRDKRLIPIGDDGSLLKSTNDLDINLTFGAGGATDKVTYFIYVFYTDINMVLDLKNHRFYPFYKRARSSN